jgi:hypothetical protein
VNNRTVPAPVPDDLLVLLYTTSQGGRITLAVYACTQCGAMVPEAGTGQHRRWHAALREWVTDLQADADRLSAAAQPERKDGRSHGSLVDVE